MAEGHLRRSHLLSLVGAECLRDVGFNATQLIAVGFGLVDLKEGRFTVSELRESSVAVKDLSAARYTAAELREGGVASCIYTHMHTHTHAYTRATRGCDGGGAEASGLRPARLLPTSYFLLLTSYFLLLRCDGGGAEASGLRPARDAGGRLLSGGGARCQVPAGGAQGRLHSE